MPRVQDDGLGLGRVGVRVRVAQDEPTWSEALEMMAEFGWILGLCGAGSDQAVEHALAIGVGLQPTNASGSGVRERAIVEVHWVLRGHDDPNPKKPELASSAQPVVVSLLELPDAVA